MILESVRYYVRYASFCNFRSPEIVSEIKGFRHFCFRLTDKFSRPPRCDHFDKPAYFLKFVFRILAWASIFAEWRNISAYEILLNTWAFEVARRRRIRFATFGGRRNKPAYKKYGIFPTKMHTINYGITLYMISQVDPNVNVFGKLF